MSPPGPRGSTLVLFDIDGTLVSTNGAGRAAMAMAAGRVFGKPDLFEGLSFAGSIDNEIVSRALALAGIPPTPRRMGRLHRTYLRLLQRTLPTTQGTVHPGARQAVAAVSRRARAGLLTGNWRGGAEAKLRHYDLWHPFNPRLGAFGQDADDRDGLVPVAWRRARRLGGPARRIVIIGDTPADVRCARVGQNLLEDHGVQVFAVAVATGFAERDALVDARPDLLVDDLDSGFGQVMEVVG